MRAFAQEGKDLVKACEAGSGTRLTRIGTGNAARDMDVMRAALGDAKLNYFGISYGTRLGSVYAHLFPKNVGRMVLDAAVTPDAITEQLQRDQANGGQLALNNFLDACVKQPGCPFGTTRPAAMARLQQVMTGLDTQPLRSGGRQLTQGMASRAIFTFLVGGEQQGWPLLEQGLTEALRGNPKILIAGADQDAARLPNGAYNDNSRETYIAVRCDDEPERYTPDQVSKLAAAITTTSPIVGPVIAWETLQCDGWPGKGAGAWSEQVFSALPRLVMAALLDRSAAP